MRKCQFLCSLSAAVALGFFFTPPAEARSKKADKYLVQGRAAEVRKDYDAALEFFEMALSENPQDAAYILAVQRIRLQAGQFHVDQGQVLRKKGQLQDALAEFEKAYAIDPASSIAEQEITTTRSMIERVEAEKKQGGKPEEVPLPPGQRAKKQAEERGRLMRALPELKPLNPQSIPALKMNNQPPKVLFETVSKLAGINVIFDPEYQQQGPARNYSVELNNSTLEEALDYLSVMTKSFWKPLSENAIFVTQDTTPKRNDYEEQVVKVFYLSNVTTAQELTEIATTVRTVTEIRRVYQYNGQNAIIVRGEADRVALAEKLISDMDKPKPEVVVDVLVLEVLRNKSRDLTVAVAPTGATIPINFTPRLSIQSPSSASGSDSTSSSSSNMIPLSSLPKITTKDFSTTLPNAMIEALMTDRGTRILQRPQVRAADGQKATLRIGDRVPVASGSFQPGYGGVGINPLVNTQFQYIDVGVNVDITAKIHGTDEISMHVELEVSNVKERINLGGIEQPVIGQRKAVHDVRVKEGQGSILGGLMQVLETKSVAGVPGLSSIPGLGRLFMSESIEKQEGELMFVLIPHVVRAPEINEVNLKGIAAGNQNTIKISYAPRVASAAVAPVAQPARTAEVTPPVTAPPAGPPVTAPPVTAPGAQPPADSQPPAPPPALRVAFAPGKVDAQVAGTVNVNLVLDNATGIFAAPMRIKFDPKVLRLTDVVRGNLMAADGQQVVFTKNIMNDAGEATVNLSRTPTAGGISGSGTLVTLVFQAVASGTTTVTIPQFAPRDAKLQTVLTASPEVVVTVK